MLEFTTNVKIVITAFIIVIIFIDFVDLLQFISVFILKHISNL